MKHILIVILGLILYSCNDLIEDLGIGEKSSETGVNTAVYQDLSRYGMKIALTWPSDTLGDLKVKWNDHFGRVECSAGKHADFFICNDIENSIERKKFDLETGVFSVQYIEEGEDLLFYKTTLPDGSAPYYHFHKSIGSGDEVYHFESNPLIEFTEKDVRFMIELVSQTLILGQD